LRILARVLDDERAGEPVPLADAADDDAVRQAIRSAPSLPPATAR
jgi:hypothetical protein